MAHITYSITACTENVEGSSLTYGRAYIYRGGVCVAQACGASLAHAVRRACADVRMLRKCGWR